MAEIVGTVVGVLSFGIQVCQGLVSYYQSCKDQDEKVNDVLRDVDQLSITLANIQSCLSKLHDGQFQAISQVSDSVIACGAAIVRLNQLLAKCHQTAVPVDFRERMGVLTRRAVFPFQQNTIKDLRDTVKGLQTNLLVALQVLHL